MGSGMNMYLLGDTFLRHFYTTFNYDPDTTAAQPHYKIELSLNAQYVKDGYVNKKQDSSTKFVEFVEHDDPMPYPILTDRIADIKNYGDLHKYDKQYYVVQLLAVAFTFFLYIGVHLYQNTQSKKRIAMMELKKKAATGFYDAENNKVT